MSTTFNLCRTKHTSYDNCRTFEEESEDVESYQCADYNFEGYNIYQGESPNGPWHRVATYDLVNGIKTILDFELDNVTGEILEFPFAKSIMWFCNS